MIRALWVAMATAFATLFFGLIAIIGSVLRIRGRLYFWATQQWSRAILRASAVRVIPHGMDRLDWSEPRIVVSNHVSIYDVYALAGILPAPYAFVAKKELERIPFFGTAWKAAGHISIDRTNRASAVQSLRRAGESIRANRSTVIIFPEGTRSTDGRLLPFKKGAFVLAMEADVPVVPVVVKGSAAVYRSGSPRVTPGPIEVIFGEPLQPGKFGADVEGLMAATRARMASLLGETERAATA